MSNKETISVKPTIDALAIYFEEIRHHPLLTREQEKALFLEREQGEGAQTRLAEGDGHLTPEIKNDLQEQIEAGRRAHQTLIESNLRLVVATVRPYIRSGLPLLDLIQEGNRGLLKAVERFDWRRGNKFSTYAVYWIRQRVIRSLAETRNVHLPYHIEDLLRKTLRIEGELTAKLGREPTFEEIARKLKTEPERVMEILALENNEFSLDTPIEEEGRETLMSFLIDEELVSSVDEVKRDSLKEEMRDILAILTPRERRIIEMRFGLDGKGEKKLSEVGQELGITRERVRQIQLGALNKLRHPQRARKLKGFIR
jgi:RNA polymerase primary sigma factor